MDSKSYCTSLTEYHRRHTHSVNVGTSSIGGANPICLQTMCNTPTSAVDDTVEQVIVASKAGAEIVRITVPSLRDVEYLSNIRTALRRRGITVPLVADIHFNQKIAFEAARVVEKVRINPGNFADSKKFDKLEYTNDDYQKELQRIEEDFLPLLAICREYKTALRIGTNHGSLSDRILSRYGDTPEGMAESAMEFLRICSQNNFNQVIISMKASNARIMVQATRLLVAKMNQESMTFPLHLGVTEAGEGEDGRIKSAVGIGALLSDGIGDTIRVSLTEPPENEIPVAQKLAAYITQRQNHEFIEPLPKNPLNAFDYVRRKTLEINGVGGNNPPVVISEGSIELFPHDLTPDILLSKFGDKPFLNFSKSSQEKNIPIIEWTGDKTEIDDSLAFIDINCKQIITNTISRLRNLKNKILILTTTNINGYADQRAAILRLVVAGISLPVILKRSYFEDDLESLQIYASADLGGLFLDGLGDGIWIENSGNISIEDINSVAFGILQASRVRMTRTEFISCPSCGRTMFDLQETTRKIRERTSHLKGLKLGIMGCIVNGLGEMADADYGYIGSGAGKVNLYYSKELIKRGIPADQAVDELIDLIKEKGDWIEP